MVSFDAGGKLQIQKPKWYFTLSLSPQPKYSSTLTDFA